MSVGRNEPCPCGSGAKYKKCCLSKSAPSSNELFRQTLQKSRNELIHIHLKHISKVYGPSAIEEAWDEFHQWENEDGFDPHSNELQLFMPWFFFDWTPDPEDTDVFETAPLELSPAQSLLQHSDSKLTPLQREYTELCAKSGFSFYEILEAWPGKGFKTKDVLTGEFADVIEKQGSMNAEPGHLVFGKTVTIHGLTTLEACSPIIIPPIFKIKVLDLKTHLHKQNPVISRDTLWEYDPEIQSLYQIIYKEVTQPRMPVLVNTDGDLLIPHKLTYDLLVEPEEAFNALASLCASESKEGLLESAVFENGTLSGIKFPWTKLGNAKHAGWENTVLGHVCIEGQKMTVDVNSERRADEFQLALKKKLKSGYKLKARVIESAEQSLKARAVHPSHDSDEHDEHDELAKIPEVQARLAQMMKSHWDGWIHDKIPALGHKTPLAAAKTQEGREALDALLTQFEFDATRKPQPGAGPEVFQDIRAKLGL